jgi:hypothetical protein
LKYLVEFECLNTWISHHHVYLFKSENCSFKGRFVIECEEGHQEGYARELLRSEFPSGAGIVSITKTTEPAYKPTIRYVEDMNKYEAAIEALEKTGTATLKMFGNSMVPLITSGSELTFEKVPDDQYAVGDVVFCKVKGSYLAHKIVRIDSKGRFMIANNRGRENGWTSAVYGRLVKVVS